MTVTMHALVDDQLVAITNTGLCADHWSAPHTSIVVNGLKVKYLGWREVDDETIVCAVCGRKAGDQGESPSGVTRYRVVVTDEEGTALDNYEVEVDEPFKGSGPDIAEQVLRELR